MAETADAVIIGAGAIGCVVAYELAKAGLVVTVVERGEPGREASWASAGLVSHPPAGQTALERLRAASHARYPGLVEELKEVTGSDVEFRRTGGVHPCRTEDQVRALRDALARGEAGEWLEPEEALRREPCLSRDILGAAYFPSDWQVRSPRFARTLAAAAARAGARFVCGRPATRILRERDRAAGVEAVDVTVHAPVVVIAAGSWSRQVGALAGYPLPVGPARGQVVLLQGSVGRVRHVVHIDHLYLVPRGDGRLIVGATVEFAGFDTRPTAGGVRRLLEEAQAIAPGLADLAFSCTWVGLRPHAERPLLGPVPGCRGLYAATGHFRSGTLLAPITGVIMRELITEGTTEHPVQEFAVPEPAASGA